MPDLDKCPFCGHRHPAYIERDGEYMHYCANCDTWIAHSTIGGNKAKHVCQNCRKIIDE